MATTQLQFTPVTALVGGLTLGIVAVGKFAITGRILGISGALKGFVHGAITSWRVLFTLGMIAGSLIARGITPDAFDVLPATFTVRQMCCFHAVHSCSCREPYCGTLMPFLCQPCA